MDKKEFFEFTAEVGKYWGKQMPMMAVEECGELIQAISKLKRYEQSKDWYAFGNSDKAISLRTNLIEEIGDVLISCMALMHNENISVDLLEEYLMEEYLKMKLNKKY